MHRRIAEERRAEIVEAVIRTLAEEGLSFPSYDAIASRADLSRQLVRHYFPDPEELMVTACQRFAQTHIRRLSGELVHVAPDKRLDRLLDLLFRRDGGGGPDGTVGGGAMVEAMGALGPRSPAIRHALEEQWRELQTMIAEELRQSGRLPPELCGEVSALLGTVLAGHAATSGPLAGEADDPGALRRAVERILEGYGTVEAGA